MFPASKVTLKTAVFRTAPKTELMVSKERLRSSPTPPYFQYRWHFTRPDYTRILHKAYTCIKILVVSTAWDSTRVDKLQRSTPLAS